MVHDFELLEWIGANSFRTSHYPYAEEVLDYADRHGIVVIDETAAVGLNMGLGRRHLRRQGRARPSPTETINDATREVHRAGHPRARSPATRTTRSVVLWSIANEPESDTDGVARLLRAAVRPRPGELDPTRPVGFVNVMLAPPDGRAASTSSPT